MTPQNRLAIEVAAGTIVLFGLIFGYIERRYAPTVIVTQGSTILPVWVGWSGWILAAVGSVAYILMDIIEWRVRRRLQERISFRPVRSLPLFRRYIRSKAFLFSERGNFREILQNKYAATRVFGKRWE